MNTKSILLIAVLAFTVSCTRKAGQEKLSVSIPSTRTVSKGVGALDEDRGTLAHVVINVTGSDISGTMVYNWDGCTSCRAQDRKTAPASHPMPQQVRSDVDHAIQLLAVYVSETTGEMHFFYGEGIGKGGTVEVPVTALGTGKTIISGQIQGRYLTGPDSGPTGSVEIRLKPYENKPGLIIERSNMVNGWFSFFGLTNVNFEYELMVPGGTNMKLFGGTTSLEKFLPSNRVMVSWHPEMKGDEGDNSFSRVNEPEINVMGYFGPADLSNKRVCRNDLTGTLPRYKVHQADGSAGALIQLQNGTVAPENLSSLLARGNTHIKWAGGEGGTAANLAACLAGRDELTGRFLTLKPFWEEGGREALPGFGAPLRWKDLTDKRILTVSSTGGDNRTVSGKFLPGGGAVIKKVMYYTKAVASSNGGGHDDLECQMLAAGKTDYVANGEASVNAAGEFTGGLATTGTILGEGDMTGNGPGLSVAMCLVTQNDLTLPVAVTVDPWSLKDSGGGGGTYLRLEFGGGASSDNMGRYQLLNYSFANQCYPVSLHIYEGMGSPVTLEPASASITLDLNGTADTSNNAAFGGTFYSNDTCTTATDPLFYIDANESYSGFVYFKPTVNVTLGQFTNATVADPEYRGFSFSTSSNAVTVIAGPDLNLMAPEKILKDRCYPVQGNMMLGTQTYTPSSPQSIDLSGTSYTFYANGTDCRSSTNPITNLSGISTSYYSYWIKPTQLSSANLQAAIGAIQSPAVSPIIGDPATEPTEAQRIVLSYEGAPGPIPRGTCVSFTATVVNKNGFEVPSQTDRTIEFGFSGAEVQFFNGGMCTTVATNPIKIFAGETSTFFMARVHAGSLDFANATTGGIPLVNSSGTLLTTVTATVPGDSTDWAYLTAPKFKTLYLGKNSFTGPGDSIPVPFFINPTALIVGCTFFDGAAPAACDATQWDPATKTIRWKADDSIYSSDATYTINYTFQQQSRDLVFKPSELYQVVNPMAVVPFEVFPCDLTLTADQTTIELDTEFTNLGTPDKYICLGNLADHAVTVTYDTDVLGIEFGGVSDMRALIGWVDYTNPSATQTIVGNLTADMPFIALPSNFSGWFYLANMKFNFPAAAYTTIGAVVSAETNPMSAEIHSSGNHYFMPNGLDTATNIVAGIAVQISSAEPMVFSSFDRFQIQSSSGSLDNAAGIYTDGYAIDTMVSNATFEIGIGASSIPAKGLHIKSASSDNMVHASNFSGSGIFLKDGGNSHNLGVYNSNFHATGSDFVQPIVFDNAYGNISFNSSNFLNDRTGNEMIRFFNYGGGTSLNLELNSSRFIQNVDESPIWASTSGSGSPMSYAVTARSSHFVYGGSSASVSPIKFSEGGSIPINFSLAGTPSDTTGGVRLCKSGSQDWNLPSGNMHSGTITGGYSPGSITIPGNTALIGTSASDWVCD